MADNTAFLLENQNTFIQMIRHPVPLADELRQNKCLTPELYDEICAEKTKQGQTRKIFSFLNCSAHFDCTFSWLKKNEPDLIKELNTKQDCCGDEAPKKKRSRRETPVDEADNADTLFPDLKSTSTFAKLEAWLSDEDHSQRLIERLEEKLGARNLENLKKELRGKEVKTSLSLNAVNIADIKKNKELEKFLNTEKGANFPKLIFSMFFKNRSSASSGKKAKSSTDDKENMDTIAYDLNSSGFGSNTNSTQNYDETPDGVLANENENKKDATENEDMKDATENEDKKDVKKTHSDGQPQPSGQTPSETPNQEEKTQLPITRGSEDMPEANAHKSTFGAVLSWPNPKPAPKTNKVKKPNNLKEKTQREMSLLRDWAARQCNDGEINNIINQISIINKAEHPVYPFFTAENIRLYKNPTTNDVQILFITTEKTSSATKTTLQYLMFVCEVTKAVLLGPKDLNEQHEYEESFINKCLRFISEALAPTLALFLRIQKEEFDALICG